MSLPKEKKAITPVRSKPQRRTQEERRQETRMKLLEATVRLLIERGYSGLTVDDVSARAGLTNGARAHHFSTKLDLIAATFDHLLTPVLAGSQEAAGKASDVLDPLSAFFDYSITIFLSPHAIAFNELLVGARTDAALRERILPRVDVHHDDIHEPWVVLLSKRGYDAREVQSMMAATAFFMRGMVTDPLIDLQSASIKGLVAYWRETMSERLTGAETKSGRTKRSKPV